MSGNSYVRLVKTNRTYRRFWLAAFVSMFGEWFNTIALFLLILEYTDSELLLGILMAVRMGSFALMQPLFGLLADRVNRKKLMIITNVFQIGLALAFIGVNGPEDMWWMFTISGIMMALHGLYVTAERAAIPNIVSEEDLATANALDSATWSAALMFRCFFRWPCCLRIWRECSIHYRFNYIFVWNTDAITTCHSTNIRQIK